MSRTPTFLRPVARAALTGVAVGAALLGACLTAGPSLAAEGASGPIRRFALVVGANDGGSDRVTLRYAQDDARAFLDVLTDLGGVDARDAIVLTEPDAEDFGRALYDLGQRVRAAGDARTEVVFYYSGHSDERGLLLRGDEVTYKTVRDGLASVPADVRIAVVDSCASGALTRTKGGTITAPFLLDESRVVTGHAYLTSASADEAAQEADRLLGSFFTHALVSGLRGAADASGDGRVTLSEAYTFAYDETLLRTENTRFGPQHATRQMDLTGTGDLVMTDLSAIDAGLVLSGDLAGRLSVRDSQGRLIAEVTKVSGRPMELGLGAGRYRLVLEGPEGVYEGKVWLARGQRQTLSMADLEPVERIASVARGDAPLDGTEDVTEEPLEHKPMVVGLWAQSPSVHADLALTAVGGELGAVGGMGLTLGVHLVRGDSPGALVALAGNVTRGHSASQLSMGGNYAGSLDGLQLSMGANGVARDMHGIQASMGFNTTGERHQGLQLTVGANVVGRDLRGAQLSVGGNLAVGAVEGFQGAVGANIAGGPVRGGQVAVGLNVAPASSRAFQISSGVNIAGNDLHGAQIGMVNVGWDLTGSQIGLVNVAREVRGSQIGLVNVAKRQDGVSVGLVQLVKEGQLHGEVWASDTLPANAGVQFGGRRVFTQIHVGGDPRGLGLAYTGAGLGVRIQRLAPRPEPGQEAERDGRLWAELDVGGGSLWQRGSGVNTDTLGVARASVGYQLAPHFSPEVGVALYVYGDTSGDSSTELRSLALPDGIDEDAAVAVWPSVFAGVQF